MRAYLDANGGPFSSLEDVLSRHPLIGWEEATIGIQVADWLHRTAPIEAFAYRANSLVNQCLAVKAGIGLALLPCYLGDGDPDLARALPAPVTELAGELWIVTHADLKRTARVRAFFDIVGEALAREQSRFDGRDQLRDTAKSEPEKALGEAGLR
jgi:DNA-binding transcriptional LysR family regulator